MLGWQANYIFNQPAGRIRMGFKSKSAQQLGARMWVNILIK
jgi:hypothetical protein